MWVCVWAEMRVALWADWLAGVKAVHWVVKWVVLTVAMWAGLKVVQLDV